MYRNCLFCARLLGTNSVIEHFPVGRRLAFDAARGRLWVVCRRCERWNLVPVVERWEAIEELERTFTDLSVRYSTEHVGLARHPGGLDLVRVGKPRRPEFAAWRYGDQFGRRMRRRLAAGGVAVGAAGAVAAAAAASAIAAPFLGVVGLGLFYAMLPVLPGVVKDPTIVRLSDGRRKGLSRGRVGRCLIVPSDTAPGWAIRVSEARFDPDDLTRPPQEAHVEYTGDDARIIASRMIPAANRLGAGARTAQDAVGLVEAGGGGDAAVRALTADTPRIGSLARPGRLALEMALHEETERQALEGELAALEAQWRAAEELAAISDGLLVPDEVERKLKRMKEAPGPDTDD